MPTDLVTLDSDAAMSSTRRDFLTVLGGAGASLALGATAGATGVAPDAWDVTWVARVRRARHRALFDAPSGGDTARMLAARFLDKVAAAYGDRALADTVAVLNLRTRSVGVGLGDALWRKYPLAEDYNVKDTTTTDFARRNVDLAPTPGMEETYAALTLDRLRARGALFLVCDFALGHLATRVAQKVGAMADAVHAEFRAGLVPGAVLVPSGIFGLAEAQNAGCAFVPA